ncbi:hypothetical protein NDU88_002956 [Pleurodeles waltl]|uniref:Uncharacterized protein n=1 Tax=Pleurodeles waltl TaxID=8319 RepID=A0AAV7T3C9_PLEWA|nr:hypothetical protein NDU88_002956 [Pleurodeles waltl]
MAPSVPPNLEDRIYFITAAGRPAVRFTGTQPLTWIWRPAALAAAVRFTGLVLATNVSLPSVGRHVHAALLAAEDAARFGQMMG